MMHTVLQGSIFLFISTFVEVKKNERKAECRDHADNKTIFSALLQTCGAASSYQFLNSMFFFALHYPMPDECGISALRVHGGEEKRGETKEESWSD